MGVDAMPCSSPLSSVSVDRPWNEAGWEATGDNSQDDYSETVWDTEHVALERDIGYNSSEAQWHIGIQSDLDVFLDDPRGDTPEPVAAGSGIMIYGPASSPRVVRELF
ncbi:hypothetical protein SPBR_05424 [Sporothrix brasiliensis 5110]|uniref:Uncharacterized protein n=1 Tax=Sporothrix brasiliensis 5110 TaxID=1398154 RepID=A0A0C2IEN4_9PEZI|nr:uncharacterized protein SPBR_05424 [Sporothrix brasiliensis 5110]KIH87696.1 hypothetical protein SPBR_05424 [Sporothrix brasiliensis 5110]